MTTPIDTSTEAAPPPQDGETCELVKRLKVRMVPKVMYGTLSVGSYVPDEDCIAAAARLEALQLQLDEAAGMACHLDHLLERKKAENDDLRTKLANAEQERDGFEQDYLRRHRDACHRWAENYTLTQRLATVEAALRNIRYVFVIAVGDQSPFARKTLELIDAALASAARDAPGPERAIPAPSHEAIVNAFKAGMRCQRETYSSPDAAAMAYASGIAPSQKILEPRDSRISALEATLNLYRDAVRIDPMMEGPRYAGCNSSALKRAWEYDRGQGYDVVITGSTTDRPANLQHCDSHRGPGADRDPQGTEPLVEPRESGRATAWMVEWPQDDNMPARWWHPVGGWMLDPLKGMRLARKEDAEAVIAKGMFCRGMVATEHVFGLSVPEQIMPSPQNGEG